VHIISGLYTTLSFCSLKSCTLSGKGCKRVKLEDNVAIFNRTLGEIPLFRLKMWRLQNGKCGSDNIKNKENSK
jgi:hypothetical protein